MAARLTPEMSIPGPPPIRAGSQELLSLEYVSALLILLVGLHAREAGGLPWSPGRARKMWTARSACAACPAI